MSDFFSIISNVKIVKSVSGTLLNFGRESQPENFSDIFPPADIIMRKGVVHIFADIPGISCDDIAVYVYDNNVVLEGSKYNKGSYSGYELIRLERHFPSFRRVFKMPFTPCRYEAFLKEGVIHILLAD